MWQRAQSKSRGLFFPKPKAGLELGYKGVFPKPPKERTVLMHSQCNVDLIQVDRRPQLTGEGKSNHAEKDSDGIHLPDTLFCLLKCVWSRDLGNLYLVYRGLSLKWHTHHGKASQFVLKGGKCQYTKLKREKKRKGAWETVILIPWNLGWLIAKHFWLGVCFGQFNKDSTGKQAELIIKK